jgi:hypothetical protein
LTDYAPAAVNATNPDQANAEYIDQLAAKHAADPAGFGEAVMKAIRG